MSTIMVGTIENDDKTFTGLVMNTIGDVLYETRDCRLQVQALRLAQDWVDKRDKKKQDAVLSSITLDVQNMSIDASQIISVFGRSYNG